MPQLLQVCKPRVAGTSGLVYSALIAGNATAVPR